MTHGGRLELRNGRIVDVKRGRYFPSGVRLVIEDGRIAALPGLPGQPELEASECIDLGGRAVIPGLINSHVHVNMPFPGVVLSVPESMRARRFGRAQIRNSLVECVHRGVTTIRDGFYANLQFVRNSRAAISRGELPGPRYLQAVLVAQEGGTFSTRPTFAERHLFPKIGLPYVDPDDPQSGLVVFPADASEARVRDAVDRAIDERGADAIKLYEQREKKLNFKPGATLMTQRQLDAAADQARRRGVITVVHHVSVESFRRSVRAGVDVLAHLPIDSSLTVADVRSFVKAGCRIEPTATLAYFYGHLLPDAPGHPRLRRLRQLRAPAHRQRIEPLWLPDLRPIVRRSLDRVEGGDLRAFGLFEMSAPFLYYSRYLTHGFDNLRSIVAEAGLDRVACGNDSGPSPSSLAGVGLELEMLDFCLSDEADDGRTIVPPAFTASDALRVATINSAEALGLGDELGTIAPGTVADLAILDGDPLERWQLLGEPVAALVQGGKLVVNQGLVVTR